MFFRFLTQVSLGFFLIGLQFHGGLLQWWPARRSVALSWWVTSAESDAPQTMPPQSTGGLKCRAESAPMSRGERKQLEFISLSRSVRCLRSTFRNTGILSVRDFMRGDSSSHFSVRITSSTSDARENESTSATNSKFRLTEVIPRPVRPLPQPPPPPPAPPWQNRPAGNLFYKEAGV